jgi:hypothetical protein
LGTKQVNFPGVPDGGRDLALKPSVIMTQERYQKLSEGHSKEMAVKHQKLFLT